MLGSVLIFLFAALVLLPIAIAWKTFAPWVPTKTSDVERVFDLANLKPGEVFYDLGSGDGKMIIYAAKNFQAKSVGLELAFPMVLVSYLRKFISKEKNLQIKWRSLFKENLEEADVVYIFGVPQTLGKSFQKKLEKELKPGTRVISYAFKVGDLEPVVISQPSQKQLPIYVYQF